MTSLLNYGLSDRTDVWKDSIPCIYPMPPLVDFNSQWTCSSGSDRFALVDDVAPIDGHDSDSTYISVNYSLPTLSQYFTSYSTLRMKPAADSLAFLDSHFPIDFIRVGFVARHDDAGGVGTCFGIIHDTGWLQGNSFTMTTSYLAYHNDFHINSASNPWSWDQIAALEFGVRGGAATAGNIRVTAVYCDVYYKASMAGSRITPNSDTATEELTLSTGSDSYALVDEFLSPIRPDDWIYWYNSAVEKSTIFGFPTTGLTTPTINYVMAVWWDYSLSLTVEGLLDSQAILVVDSTEYTIGNIFGGQPHYRAQAWENSPDTSTAWTWSEVNAIEAGISVTSATDSYKGIRNFFLIVNYSYLLTPDLDAVLYVAATTYTEETDLDAYLKETVTVDLDLDAFLKKFQALEPDLDALLNGTGLTGDLDLDSYLVGEATVDTDLDAYLYEVFTGEPDLDAILQKTDTSEADLDALLNETDRTASADLDAYLYEILSSTTDLNALLNEQGLTVDTDLDAITFKVYTPDTDLDALLNATGETSDTDLDAYLNETALSVSCDLDAALIDFLDENTQLDALLNAIGEIVETDFDAILYETFTEDLDLNGLLNKAGITASSDLDSLLQGEEIVATDLDSLLTELAEKDLSLNALCRENDITFTIDLDALLQKVKDVSTDLDARLFSLGEKTTDLDALLNGLQTVETALDAHIISGTICEVALDALTYNLYTKQTVIDALLNGQGEEITAEMDAYLAKLKAVTTELDALLTKVQVADTELDGLLSKTFSGDTDLDSILSQTVEVTSETDALLNKPGQVSTTDLDSLLNGLGLTRTITIDAELFEVNLVTLTVDSILKKAFGVTTLLDKLAQGIRISGIEVDGVLVQGSDNAESHYLLKSRLF